MPWTESRSRDEWLTEVTRRGARIRRRRRVGFGVVGAMALVLPVSGAATVLRFSPDRAVELSVAGPALDGEVPTTPTTLIDEPIAGSSAGATGEAPPPTGAPSPTTTTTEVHRRVSSVNGSVVEPAAPTSVPPADDPVVRPTTTLVALSSSVPTDSPRPTAGSPSAAPTCRPPDHMLTVTTDKPAYAAGEAVRVTATLENRGPTACRLLSVVHVRIDNAAGRNVVSFPNEIAIPVPDLAEPGKAYSGSYTWDQRDCVNAACAPAPAGTYTAYGEAPTSAPFSFRIGA